MFYGASIVFFGHTMYHLTRRGSKGLPMILVSLFLMANSTLHFAVASHRLMGGISRTKPASLNLSSVTFDTLAIFQTYYLQTLVGDAMLVYRAYVLWQPLPPILPILCWMASAVLGALSWVAAKNAANVTDIFVKNQRKFNVSFYALTLATNLLATSAIVVRLWMLPRQQASVGSCGKQLSLHVRQIIAIVVDAGLVYSALLIAAIITLLNGSSALFIIISVLPAFISITFFVIITRFTIAQMQSDRETYIGTGSPCPSTKEIESTSS